ncbi:MULTISPECIES: hypothetical protein [unclassified Nocardioides]|uniref:hypothetical protein n=1 Tax=unclassified Nocardioides TaxID=2615069 RepID=UPI0009F0A835|nr:MULTISPECIES: hypothetical protein [unclassified Nocardioides]GAW51330.1 uncharacterized protein (Precursor) [Nocardioides sp. PD653-B2]GAW52677.1 uncharacterized protein (Precursor) [Nocardioides sp. PD653]
MQLISRTLARLVAAAALAAAASAVVPSAPASAATCSSADGVSVVVDFHELGGGVRTACVPDGGEQRASSLFPAAGFPLTYVQRQPGFVCTVSGAPADDPCVNTPPADAYWGLWWSDGRSGSWTYASTSAAGLTVPDGGYVAFSWNGSSTRSTPGAAPATHPTQPTPTTSPTHATPTPTAHPSHTGGAGQPPTSPRASDATDPTASATLDPTGPGSAEPGGTKKTRSASPPPADPPSASESTQGPDDTVPVSADPADPGGGGLPAWVAPVVIAALFAGAGGAAVVRRRRGTPGP